LTVRNVFGGESRIGFKNCEQGREKFQGTSLDAVWFDEEPPRDVYEECRMRVLDRKGDVYGTMTPLKGLTWVYDLIYLNSGNDPEIWCAQMEWADNPYLDAAEIAALTASMGAEELDGRRYGKFTAHGGQVYPEFDPCVHVIDPFAVPPEWYDNISIDPGLRNPLSAHWYAVDYDGNVYVVAEHYEAGRDVAYHAARIKEICARLSWHTDRAGRPSALIDSAASARTLAGSKSVCELFFEHGIAVNPRVDKDLFSGIQRVKGFLRDGGGKPRLFIFRSCTNLIREIKGYFWGNDDVPKKKDDHALDELRYYLASRPAAHEQRTEKSEITRDKEKLIRANGRKRREL
jgi:phage terminase large subunit-like protein